MRIAIGGNTVFVSTGSGKHVDGAPAIVFVHGAGHDHSVWVMPARFFARHGFNVAAVDLPGHGRSAGPPLDRITDMSDWLHTVLQNLGFAQTVVVGHSMGSLVAAQFATDHARACRAIALLGTSMPMPVTEMLLNAAADDHHAAIDMANTWSHAGKVGASSNPGVWMLGSGERLMERAGPGVFHADLEACNSFSAPQGLVECSALVIAGDSDQMTPAKAGLSVADGLPEATVVRLEGCGHAMLSERPNAVLDALWAFVEGLV